MLISLQAKPSDLLSCYYRHYIQLASSDPAIGIFSRNRSDFSFRPMHRTLSLLSQTIGVFAAKMNQLMFPFVSILRKYGDPVNESRQRQGRLRRKISISLTSTKAIDGNS